MEYAITTRQLALVSATRAHLVSLQLFVLEQRQREPLLRFPMGAPTRSDPWALRHSQTWPLLDAPVLELKK